MENENPRGVARTHPYKNNSPGRLNFRVGITHNYFSFANNTNSLFPQQQKPNMLKLAQNELESSKQSNENAGVPSGNTQVKRQPFQDLTANASNRFIKLPSSCKIAESSVTLVPDALQLLKNQQKLNISYDEPMDNSPSTSSATNEPTEESSAYGSNDNNMSICEETSSTPTPNTALYDISKSLGFQPDYCVDILTHWAQIQHRVRPRKYMEKQHEISYRMRSILIDWLVEVSQEFECSQETLFLAANIVDRFLAKMNVPRNKLQLIGTSSLFIACKFEEPSPPGIKDFVHITDDTYSKEQILRMELIILQALDYDLITPTPFDFAKAFCSLLRMDIRSTHLAMYLAELALIDGETFTTVLPSLIGTSAVALGRWAYQGVFWDDSLCALNPHVKKEVQLCASALCAAFYAAPLSQHKAVFEKYKSEAYSAVAVTNHLEKLPWG